MPMHTDRRKWIGMMQGLSAVGDRQRCAAPFLVQAVHKGK